MSKTAVSTCAICAVHAESTFRVDGMDCHEEVAILERRLNALGVESLRADVVARRLVVAYGAAVLTSTAIASAVAETGMRAWIEQDGRTPHSQDAVPWRLLLVGLSGLAIGAGALLSLSEMPPALVAVVLSVAIVASGVHPVRRAWVAVRHGALDINVLMTMAVAGAILLGDWFEAATVVFLFGIAQLLESFSMERARRSLGALMDLSPKEATIRRDGREERVKVDALAIGEVVLIRPGEKVPVDGTVVAGESDVNQAPVTGESLPVAKSVGASLFAGSINGHGALEVVVTRLGNDSTIARIIHLVEHAQGQRAETQAFVDRFARIYTPAVVLLASLVAVIPPLVLEASFASWAYRALVLLVIACPCALVISTPVSIVSALTAAARRGVLVKGGIHLERLAKVRAVAFDKTGTLTRGEPGVVEVIPFDGPSAAELLRLAGALEVRSEHPIGRAIAAAALAGGSHGLPVPSSFRALPGLGAEGVVEGMRVRVGAPRLFGQNVDRRSQIVDREERKDREEQGGREEHTRYSLAALVERQHALGRTTVIVEVDGVLKGLIALADQVRPEAAGVVRALHDRGISPVVMLTGDNEITASLQARATGVDSYRANLLPEDKVEAVRALKTAHQAVAMVGDGVNDAPALALADVGIAMGAAGSDAALETADVALMADDLSKLPYAVSLSRATLRNIKMNVAFALGLKFVFLVAALFGVATMWMAVVADTGASLIVIANGLRLLRNVER